MAQNALLPNLSRVNPRDYLQHEVSFVIDKDDVIISVNSGWDRFAFQNNADRKVFSKNVVGKSLREFICGDQTMMFIFTMINSVRFLKKTIYRTYRCDSKKLKRYMEMVISPMIDNKVEIVHRLLYTEPIMNGIDFNKLIIDNREKSLIQKEVIPLDASRPYQYVKRCSLCNRVEIRQTWFDIDDILRLNLMPSDTDFKIIYGVCGDCFDRKEIYL